MTEVWMQTLDSGATFLHFACTPSIPTTYLHLKRYLNHVLFTSFMYSTGVAASVSKNIVSEHNRGSDYAVTTKKLWKQFHNIQMSRRCGCSCVSTVTNKTLDTGFLLLYLREMQFRFLFHENWVVCSLLLSSKSLCLFMCLSINHFLGACLHHICRAAQFWLPEVDLCLCQHID